MLPISLTQPHAHNWVVPKSHGSDGSVDRVNGCTSQICLVLSVPPSAVILLSIPPPS